MVPDLLIIDSAVSSW